MMAVFGQAAIEAAAPATGARVLDVGCGAGESGSRRPRRRGGKCWARTYPNRLSAERARFAPQDTRCGRSPSYACSVDSHTLVGRQLLGPLARTPRALPDGSDGVDERRQP